MPKGVPWPKADEQQLVNLVARGLSNTEIAATLGRSVSQIDNKKRRLGLTAAGKGHANAPPALAAESFEREGDGDTLTIRTTSPRIQTYEQALEQAGIDTAVWEVYFQRVKSYEGYMKGPDNEPVVVPMFSVEVKVRRNKQACLLREIGAEIIAGIEQRRPAWEASAPIVLPRAKDRHLFEVCVMDLHVGKLAWSEETGEDYDVSIAERVFTEALEDLISNVEGRCIEEVLFPIGNDLLQFDNLQKTTTGGTPQDADTRYAKVYARAEGMMRHAIERLSEIAPVRVPVIPGNHDRQSAFSLGRTLRAWFHGNDRVDVDASPRLRKYHRYGVNLIGYTHGSEEKPAALPLIMAQETGTDWSETLFREWHVGHTHVKKEVSYVAGDTHNGVRVRVIPALCPPDAWHYMRGYVGGVRSAEAYLWSRTNGYAGHFSANVLPPARAA